MANWVVSSYVHTQTLCVGASAGVLQFSILALVVVVSAAIDRDRVAAIAAIFNLNIF